MSDPEGLNRARAQLLEVASRLLVREVDRATLLALLDPALLDALDDYEPGTRHYLEGIAKDQESGLEQAAVDFCALFLVSGTTSPYASAWTPDADAAQRIVRAAEGWMRELGIEIADGEWGNIPSDHIGVLLGLVAHALHAGPRGEELAREIDDQALAWVPDFKSAVLEETQNPLYRATVEMITDALDRAPGAAR